jgi:peroxiredoxin
MTDLYSLPPDLPVPEDDGACDHLLGMTMPSVRLPSSIGDVGVRDFEVLYVYPRAGQPTPDGWDAIPGARGCTPQSCAFRDHAGELAALGARVAGLSAQSLDEQREFAERNHIPFPVIADEGLVLRDELRLPTFEAAGLTLYKRVTLVAEQGEIVKVFYPVFPPDKNAAAVVAWLQERNAA